MVGKPQTIFSRFFFSFHRPFPKGVLPWDFREFVGFSLPSFCVFFPYISAGTKCRFPRPGASLFFFFFVGRFPPTSPSTPSYPYCFLSSPRFLAARFASAPSHGTILPPPILFFYAVFSVRIRFRMAPPSPCKVLSPQNPDSVPFFPPPWLPPTFCPPTNFFFWGLRPPA